VIPTGCRRGRTPERPLRQPSQVWLVEPDLLHSRRLVRQSATPAASRPRLRGTFVSTGSPAFATHHPLCTSTFGSPPPLPPTPPLPRASALPETHVHVPSRCDAWVERVWSIRNERASEFPTAVARAVAVRRSQIDLAKCCASKFVGNTVDFGPLPFRYQTRRARGKDSEASDVPAGYRVSVCRNSAERHHVGTVPGEAEVEEPADLSRQGNEGSRGVKRSQRCISHTA
jgi:hypothetical protein